MLSLYILELSNRAYDLFKSSEVEQKRLLIKTVLSNLKICGEKMHWELVSPFDLIVESFDSVQWHPQGDLNPCFRRERAMS